MPALVFLALILTDAAAALAVPRLVSRRCSRLVMTMLPEPAPDGFSWGYMTPVQGGEAFKPATADGSLEAQFWDWMVENTPEGAIPREYNLISSSSRTVPGCLADVWASICAVDSPDAPSLTIVLLPEARELDAFSKHRAMTSHLMSCRATCSAFRSMRLMPLHPDFEAPEEVAPPGMALSGSGAAGDECPQAAAALLTE